jgi:hypothetical protein
MQPALTNGLANHLVSPTRPFVRPQKDIPQKIYPVLFVDAEQPFQARSWSMSLASHRDTLFLAARVCFYRDKN